MNRIELKSLAKEQIRGNIGMLFISALVMSLIVSAASAITAGIGTIIYSGTAANRLDFNFIRTYGGHKA